MQSSETFDRDGEHLKLLRIFHFVVGGIAIAFASLFVLHAVFSFVLFFNPEIFPTPPETPPFPDQARPMFLMLAIMASVYVVGGWIVGLLIIISGFRIGQLRSRTFSLVMAGIMCMGFPFGTALGVCTLIVLLRPSVRERYLDPHE